MPSPAEIILAKTPLPTHLDSAELRQQLSAEIRRRAFFSAKMAQLSYLKQLQRICAAYADGEINAADARARSLDWLSQLGYDGRDPRLINPASERRLNLILDTQRQMADSVARIKAIDDVEFELFPAWALVRTGTRRAPREDWPARWKAAGTAVNWKGASRIRFAALKTSPIWAALGDGAGGFKDALGNPFPPFAYSSGMNWRDLDEDEARRAKVPMEDLDTAALDVSLAPGRAELREAMRKTGLRPEDFLPPGDAPVSQGGVPAAVANTRPTFHKCPKCGKFASYDGSCDKCGETLTENEMIQRGREALSRALDGKPKDIKDAMHKPGLGRIDFLHGWEGKGSAQEHGKGLAKIQQKHHKELDRLPETIAKGKVYQVKYRGEGIFLSNVKAIVYGSNVAFLSKHGNGWTVVTHYTDEQKAREIEGYNRKIERLHTEAL